MGNNTLIKIPKKKIIIIIHNHFFSGSQKTLLCVHKELTCMMSVTEPQLRVSAVKCNEWEQRVNYKLGLCFPSCRQNGMAVDREKSKFSSSPRA